MSDQGSAVSRVARLPLFSSALRMVTSTYVDVKGRYPVLGLVEGVAMVGVHTMSLVATRRAAPILQRLEPQIMMANSYACVGLDQLEKRFPVFQLSAEEVVAHLKDVLTQALDDWQLRLNEELDVIADRSERLVERTRMAVDIPLVALQNSPFGSALASGLDDLLMRSEEAALYYLPLPASLRDVWELSLRQLEDEEGGDDEELGMWTRVRCLGLRLHLLLHYWVLQLRDGLHRALRTLGDLAEMVGLTQLVNALVMASQNFFMSGVYRLEELKCLLKAQLSVLARVFVELRPVRLALTLPGQARAGVAVVASDLLELSMILIQLLVNTTPLYNVLQQPIKEELEVYLSQEDLSDSCSSRRGSGNSLLQRVPDGHSRRRRSLYGRARLGSPNAISDTIPANGRRGSLKRDSLPSSNPELEALSLPSPNAVRRHSSAAEVLLSPIVQFVSQSL